MDFDNISTFVFDLDATVWYWTFLIPGAKATIARLKKLGKSIVYVSNNTLYCRKDLARKLTNLGIKTSYEDVINAGIVIGYYIKEQGGTALALSQGTAKDLKEAGVPTRKHAPADYVVVTEDWTFCYRQLSIAFDAVRSGGRLLTSTLGRYWRVGNKLIPGTGCWAKAVEFAAETKATTLGKPSDYMAKIVSQKLPDSKHTVLIGDDYDSDIAFGQKLGFQTIFVRTGFGVNKTSAIIPDLSLDSVKDLLPLL